VGVTDGVGVGVVSVLVTATSAGLRFL